MSYPIEYDELLTKDEVMKDITDIFDNVHLHLKEVKNINVKDKLINNPHKVTNYIKDTLIEYVKNKRPDYKNGKNNDKVFINRLFNKECNVGGHIPTKIIGVGLYQCELCSETFHLQEVGVYQ